MRLRNFIYNLPLIISTITALFAFAEVADAFTYNVTKTADTADGTCDADCSLREAITAANAMVGTDTINIPIGTYTITIAGADNSNATGDFDITDHVNITGEGVDSTIIDGGAIDRVFHIPGASTASFSGVTIHNGSTTAAGSGIFGSTGSNVSVTDSAIISNTTTSSGGGVYISNGTLNVTDSTIAGNTANVSGGGIFIFNSTVTLTKSTVSGNTATSSSGGGINNSGGTLNVYNTTISGNTATSGSGGGINNTGTATITNSTITANNAAVIGGGIRNVGAAATVTITNSIVANQTSGPDCSNNLGTITSNGNNLESATSCGFTAAGDQQNVTNPKLGVLANNGGPTMTHALQVGSPAINGGNNTVCTNAPVSGVDQRGVPRTIGAGACDIGAFEYYVPATRTVTKTADTNDGVCNADCSLREAIIAANSNHEDTINIPAGTYTITIAGASEDLSATGDFDILRSMSIVGVGGPTIIDGGALDRVFHIISGVTASFSGATIQNGSEFTGGGIRNNGVTVTVTNSNISGNTASASGGGIRNFDGTITVTNSTISGNTSTSNGGGIYNSGGTVTVTGSTISGNTSTSNGGGLNNQSGSTATITNSTISGNTGVAGGGIINWATMTITNSTIANNTDTSNMAGGILNISGTIPAILSNSIVANQASGDDCNNFSGGFTSNGNNLESGTSCGFMSAGDLQNVTNPKLGPLANNGGPTKTHALYSGSPAVNAGSCAETADQRGIGRPSAGCDIGAYEYNSAAINDFSGHGKSDILRKYSPDGRTLVWDMTGNIVNPILWTTMFFNINWEIVGFGDFNGDRKNDILWLYKPDGRTLIWFMSGNAVIGAQWTTVAFNINWEVKQVGDFNGDGRADILWLYKPDGRTLIWTMYGSTVALNQWTSLAYNINWEVLQVGDFNGDRKKDILWRYKPDGRTLIWFMSGNAVIGAQWTTVAFNINWEVKQVGDFNGDSRSDILWLYKPDGRTLLWTMLGSTVALNQWTSMAFNINWEVKRVGDYNGDGKVDILWLYKPDGRTLVWTMSGNSVISSLWTSALYNTNWTVE